MPKYTPILKVQRGEINGYSQHLENADLLPLFVFKDGFNSSLLGKLPRTFYFEAPSLAVQNELSESFEELKYEPIPVISDISSVESSKRQCLRIDPSKIDLLPKEVSWSKTSLILDFGEISQVADWLFESSARSLSEKIEGSSWEYIAVAGTTIPMTMQGIRKQHEIARKEWTTMYQMFKSHMPEIGYGDYATQNPGELENYNPKFMPSSAKIKHTTIDKFVIFKGSALWGKAKSRGFEQYHQLAKDLVNSQYYYGEDFSEGDFFIKECSEQKKTGNLESWVTVGVNHHISAQLQELSS